MQEGGTHRCRPAGSNGSATPPVGIRPRLAGWRIELTVANHVRIGRRNTRCLMLDELAAIEDEVVTVPGLCGEGTPIWLVLRNLWRNRPVEAGGTFEKEVCQCPIPRLNSGSGIHAS
jgi:hypothetical protein